MKSLPSLQNSDHHAGSELHVVQFLYMEAILGRSFNILHVRANSMYIVCKVILNRQMLINLQQIKKKELHITPLN